MKGKRTVRVIKRDIWRSLQERNQDGKSSASQIVLCLWVIGGFAPVQSSRGRGAHLRQGHWWCPKLLVREHTVSQRVLAGRLQKTAITERVDGPRVFGKLGGRWVWRAAQERGHVSRKRDILFDNKSFEPLIVQPPLPRLTWQIRTLAPREAVRLDHGPSWEHFTANWQDPQTPVSFKAPLGKWSFQFGPMC